MLKNTKPDTPIKMDNGSYEEFEYMFLNPSMPPPYTDEEGETYGAYCAGFMAKTEEDAANKNFFRDVTIGWFQLEEGEDLLEKAHDAAIKKFPTLEKCDSPEGEE